MAMITVSREDVFPAGTLVSAYLSVRPSAPDAGGPPPGDPVESRMVAANGRVTFTGLDANASYLLYAGAPDRYLRVTVSPGDVLEETVTVIGTVPAYAAPGAPDSFGKAPLPADRAVHPDSANIVAALVAQATLNGSPLQATAQAPPVFNVGNFSGATFFIDETDRVPSLKRVKVEYPGVGSTLMRAIGAAGIPFPDNFITQVDSDASAFGYHRGVLHGPGWKGRAWEFFALRRATGADLEAGWDYVCWQLTRISNADNYDGIQRDIINPYGTFEDPASDIYARPGATEDEGWGQETGVMQYEVWGTFATGATPPGMSLLATPADLKRGYARQPLRLLVSDCGPGTVGPARRDRGDGTIEGYPMVEGMLFTIDRDEPLPSGLTPPQEFLFRTAQEAGLMLTDKTGTGPFACVAVSLGAECLPFFTLESGVDGRDWSSTSLVGFPWHKLRCMVPGDRYVFHPSERNTAVLTDTSGNARHGTILNADLVAEDRGALVFGKGSTVRIPGFALPSAFSVEVAVGKTTAEQTSTVIGRWQANTPVSDISWIIGLNGGENSWWGAIAVGGAPYFVGFVDQSAKSSAVREVVLDGDGSTLRLLLDGVVVSSVAYSGTPNNPSGVDVVIGDNHNGGALFSDMTVGRVRVSGVSRRAANYTPGPLGVDGDTLAFYRCDSKD